MAPVKLRDTFVCFILLGYLQSASAYCSYNCGYGWYSSWYIWCSIIILIAICCGACGSYWRRRRLAEASMARQTITITGTPGAMPVAGAMPVPPTPVYYADASNNPPNYSSATASTNPYQQPGKDSKDAPPPPSYFDVVSSPGMPQQGQLNQAYAPPTSDVEAAAAAQGMPMGYPVHPGYHQPVSPTAQTAPPYPTQGAPAQPNAPHQPYPNFNTNLPYPPS